MATAFFILIGIICGILNAILFWKVWHMCNNVAKITNKLCGNAENTNITKTICESVAATEAPEQIPEQNSTEISSETNETHNNNAGIIIAIVLGLLICLMIIMGGY